jgi:tripartite-type tricarboxylate transporter receptor subunit TctC
MIDTATSAIPRIRNGQLRPLAVSSPERYPLMPDAPTMVETVPGIALMSWLGLAAPPQTPRPIIDRLNGEIRRALELPDIKQWLTETGVLAAPSSPEDRGGQRHQGRLNADIADLPSHRRLVSWQYQQSINALLWRPT